MNKKEILFFLPAIIIGLILYVFAMIWIIRTGLGVVSESEHDFYFGIIFLHLILLIPAIAVGVILRDL